MKKIVVLLAVSYLACGQMAAITMRHANILLTAKNLFCTGDIDVQRLNMTRNYCGYNGIQPVEFIVKNESDVPVYISAQSLRGTRIPKEQLVIQDQWDDQMFLSPAIGFCCGLALGFWEIVTAIEENNPRWRPSSYINGRQYPSFPLATISWSVIAITAFVLTLGHHGHNNHNARQLAKLMLADEIVIQPGQSVRKIAFLDAQYYNGLFTFQVLSEDKKQYVASFDVELFD